MSNTYGERPYSKPRDDARLSMHGKNPLNHHPSLPAMQPNYGHIPPSQFASSVLTASAAAGRSHSCSSPGSSASSICSTGASGLSVGGCAENYGAYTENEFSNNQPPPLLNPRSNHHRYSNPAGNMSPVSAPPYSPGSHSSNPSLMSSPLQYGNSTSVRQSSPSGSVSSGLGGTDATMPSSPSAVPIDPAYRSVLEFVDRRWKAVQAKQAKSVLNSSFDETVPSQQQTLPGSAVSSNSLARCAAPQTMPVP